MRKKRRIAWQSVDHALLPPLAILVILGPCKANKKVGPQTLTEWQRLYLSRGGGGGGLA